MAIHEFLRRLPVNGGILPCPTLGPILIEGSLSLSLEIHHLTKQSQDRIYDTSTHALLENNNKRALLIGLQKPFLDQVGGSLQGPLLKYNQKL